MLFLFCFGLNFPLRHFNKDIGGDSAQISFFSGTDGNCPGFRLLVAYNEHIGNLFQLCFPDLVADFLAAFI